MRVLIGTSVAAGLLFSATPSLANSATGAAVKRVFKAKTGRNIEHVRELDETYTFSEKHKLDGVRVISAWDGATRGPVPKNAYLALVKSPLNGEKAGELEKSVILSKNLLPDAKKRVKAYMKKEGLKGKVEFGDRITDNRGELVQHPFTREVGQLRFTVTDKNKKQYRLLVATDPSKLRQGKKDILGGVMRDNDTYGQ